MLDYLIGVAVQIPYVLREPRDAVRVILVLPRVQKCKMHHIKIEFVLK